MKAFRSGGKRNVLNISHERKDIDDSNGKYTHHSFDHVSIFTPPDLLRKTYFEDEGIVKIESKIAQLESTLLGTCPFR
jgi:hypothetical protein